MGVNDARGWRRLTRSGYRRLMVLLQTVMGLRLFLVQLGDDTSKVEAPQLPEGYRTVACTPADLLDWTEHEYGLSKDFLSESIVRGDRCVANFFHDKLVGYVFVTRSTAPLSGQLEVSIDDRLVYRYKAWTHQDHRRKHLSMARGRLNKTLFPLNPGQRTVSYVDTTNFPSRLVRPEIHPRAIGYSGYVVIAGREIPFNTPGVKAHGFRIQRLKS